jgi:hypothetical protein
MCERDHERVFIFVCVFVCVRECVYVRVCVWFGCVGEIEKVKFANILVP